MTDARFAATALQTPAAPLVRAELDRILASELFARSERLSSFLRYIVERTLSGEGASLKEHVIAVELYGKDPSFDTADDPIVRIDARRLRDKLREYYASAADAPIVVSVPKGGYTPIFITAGSILDDSHVDTTLTAGASRSKTRPVVRRWLLAAAVVLVAAVTWLMRGWINPAPQLRSFTVTSLPGSEEDPALSPDGQTVAFSWSNSDDVNHAIWIKSVGEGASRSLTNSPDTSEDWPRWSPDGQWITFTRRLKTESVVIKVSPLGGHEWTVAHNALDASWTPDSRALVMHWTTPERHGALLYQELDTGKQRVLTDAPVGFDDRHPRVSPDGKTVAFARNGPGQTAIFLVPLGGGDAVRVGEWVTGLGAGGLEWMPNGRELLAARWTGSIRRLMRIPVSGRGPDVAVPDLPYDVAGFSLSRLGTSYRLAVSTGQPDIGLRLVDLATPRSAGVIAADSPFCDATHFDIPGRFSRDGEQVAFASNRDGSFQVYVANRDGSALRPVTHLEDGMVSLGSWSRDNQRLAFDVTIRNHTDIYTVAVGGGAATKLNEGPGNASDPEWSRDGQWLYFSSDRSGSPAIWKMPANGGRPVQLTSEAGFDPRESPDGRHVYFVNRPKSFSLGTSVTLKQVSVDGGPVEDVAVPVPAGAWDVTDSGIVFVGKQSEEVKNSRGGRNVLQQYDFADHRIRTIARLGFLIGPYGVPRYLAVSGDGRWALASHVDHWERDIVALDGFR